MRDKKDKGLCRCERAITLELSDEDIRALAKRAGYAGISIPELLENFIADLTGGYWSNGSDERECARAWYARCGFGKFEKSFLQWLIEEDWLDAQLDAWDSVQECEQEIKKLTDEITTGMMESASGKTYTWKELVNGDGALCYASEEEWLKYEHQDLEGYREELDYSKGIIDEIWKEYTAYPAHSEESFEDAMKKVIKWREEYLSLME